MYPISPPGKRTGIKKWTRMDWLKTLHAYPLGYVSYKGLKKEVRVMTPSWDRGKRGYTGITKIKGKVPEHHHMW